MLRGASFLCTQNATRVTHARDVRVLECADRSHTHTHLGSRTMLVFLSWRQSQLVNLLGARSKHAQLAYDELAVIVCRKRGNIV